jgi:hypothetical protein
MSLLLVCIKKLFTRSITAMTKATSKVVPIHAMVALGEEEV